MRTHISSLLIALIMGSAAQAGNVSAFISGGHLYLYGDAGGSSLTVDSPSSGQIRVTGTVTSGGEDTVVNGQKNGTVTLDGWKAGVYNFAYAGNDSITLSGLQINGAAHMDLGEGDDSVIIGDLPLEEMLTNVGLASSASGTMSSAKSLLVIGAGGADMVVLQGLFVGGAATLDLGAGEDDVFIGNSATDNDTASVVFYESCVIIPGNEADTINITSTDVRRNLIVDDSQAALQLDISDVNVGDSTFIYGTPANDRITAVNLHVTNILKVIAEGGDDFIALGGSSTSTEVFPNAGNDSVQLNNLETTRAYVYLDPGRDELQIQAGRYSYLYAYGSSGDDLFRIQNASITQANLYGEAGTDTYQNGGGNSIGKLNLYTIENK
jgi:hypothetical protein